MWTIFRNSLIAVLACWICAACAMAMSRGAVHLDFEVVDGKPAFCLPQSDDNGDDPVPLGRFGVSRATGVASPDVTYWEAVVPASAQPAYLKRGECLVYGQTVAGALVETPAKPLDVNKFYSAAIIPAGETGRVYSAGFCVLREANGAIRITQSTKERNPCGSLEY